MENNNLNQLVDFVNFFKSISIEKMEFNFKNYNILVYKKDDIVRIDIKEKKDNK